MITAGAGVVANSVELAGDGGEPVRVLDHRPVWRQAASNLRRAVAHSALEAA